MISKTNEDEIEELDESGEELEQFEHFRFTADPGQGLLRIDKFLANRIVGTSRNRIQIAADAGSICVGGIPVKANYRVKPGDEVTIMLDYPRRELKIIPENIPLNIVYEDEELIIINKPAGLVVHPGHGNYSGTLVNGLVFKYQNLDLYGGNDPRPGLVHRIDKNTSGLLVVAKTELAKLNLALQFFHKTTKRKYVALVWGNLASDEGTIVGNIGRNANNRQVFTVYPDGDHGKPAVTHYRVLEKLGYVNLVECVLETGRTHQIRVHMKHIGHPLFNDDVYGGDRILKGTTFAKYKQFVENCFSMIPGQALHAKILGFVHPVTKEEMTFDSDLPENFAQLVDKWRNYISNRDLDQNL
jgi:23S rRNA pseudouridine1911/1915/1917 synthase